MSKSLKAYKIIIASVVYILLAILYFVPVPLPHKIALPLLALFFFSLGTLPWAICAAFACSFFGDLAGSFIPSFGDKAFVMQLGGFALAHFFYIIYFLSCGYKQKRAVVQSLKKASKNKKNQVVQNQGMYMAAVLAFVTIVIYNALTFIVPNVEAGLIRNLVFGYVIVISVMMWSALMTKDWILGLGSVIFVVSDFILAWNMFVNHIPGAGIYIMVTYYVAQLIFFCRTAVAAKK